MENRPIGPEEQDDTTDSASTKKKRGSSLSRYLSALRGKEASKDETAESNTEKPKRVQKLFQRLFPGIVERPAHLAPQETNDQEHEFNQEAWFGWARKAKQAEAIPISLKQAEDVPLVESSIAMPLETSNETPSQAIEQPVEVQPSTSAAEGSQVDQDVTRPVSSNRMPTPRTEVRDNWQAPEAIAMSAQRQGEIPLGTATETETIIERRGSNVLPLALVGAEYIGRKRADKKLEARVEKKVEARVEKQQQSEVLQKELERVVSENKQQIEQLKRARVQMERQAPRAVERKEVVPTVVASAEVRQAPRPEGVSTEQRRFTEESIRPQNIAERVADAAEHDVPVERAFERSHEVKDDIQAATTAASVGAVMAANIAAAGLPPAVSGGKPSTSGQSSLPFVSDADIAASYKQAAKMGFWTAICLIILGSIAYLMVRYI